MRLGLTFDHDAFQQAFRDIGSVEYPRAAQFALDEVAKSAVKRMKAAMPRALGQRRGKTWVENAFTLNAVRYERSRDYGSIKDITQIASAISIQPKQSTYLKYLFGEGDQTRLPGDVGLAEDLILIPNRENLFYATRIAGLSPFGNEQLPRGLMSDLQKRIAASKGKPGTQDAAMKAMGGRAYAYGQAFEPGPRLGRVAQRLNPNLVPRGAKALGHYLTVEKKATGFDPRAESPLYRGKDKTGRTTIKARPGRLRDPTGGHHTFTRKDGTTARMPNMIGISRFDGKSGRHLGPRRLFTPVSKADYEPILQAPWDVSAADAYAEFPALMQAELENRLVRRAQGRRY